MYNVSIIVVCLHKIKDNENGSNQEKKELQL